MLYTTSVLATAPSRTLDLDTRRVPTPNGSAVFVGNNRASIPDLTLIEFGAPRTLPGLADTTIDGRDVFTRGISRSPSAPEIEDALTPTHVKVERMLAA